MSVPVASRVIPSAAIIVPDPFCESAGASASLSFTYHSTVAGYIGDSSVAAVTTVIVRYIGIIEFPASGSCYIGTGVSDYDLECLAGSRLNKFVDDYFAARSAGE